MANTLSKTGITTGETVETWHVTQSVDAFTGAKAYDISISGSLTLKNGTQGAGKIAVSDANGLISFTNNITASFQGTASYASSASNALSASYAPNFANTNLTFTADRSHNTNGKFYSLTTDNAAYLQSWHYLDTTLNQIGYNINQIQFDNNNIDLFQNNTGSIRISQGLIHLNRTQFNINTKISSLNNANMFFVNAGTNRVGIGTSTPTADLHVSGSIAGGYRSVNATVVTAVSDGRLLNDNDYIVTFTASNPGVGEKNNIILPPSASAGKVIILQRITGSASCPISGSGAALINGAIGYNFDTTLYTQRTFIADGTNWYTQP